MPFYVPEFLLGQYRSAEDAVFKALGVE